MNTKGSIVDACIFPTQEILSETFERILFKKAEVEEDREEMKNKMKKLE